MTPQHATSSSIDVSDDARAGYAPPASPGRARHRIEAHLQRRKPAAVRRHATRSLRRLLVVMLGDLVALAALNAISERLSEGALAQRSTTLLATLQPWWHVDLAVLLALVVTKCYAGWSGSNHNTEVLRASLLASLLVVWGEIPRVGVASAFWAATLSFAALAAFLLTGRYGSRWSLRVLWQSGGNAPAAVLLGTSEDFLAAAALASNDDEYRLMGYLSRFSDLCAQRLGSVEQLGQVLEAHRIDTILVGDSISDNELPWIVEMGQIAGCELLYPASAVRLAGTRAKLVTRFGQPFFEMGAPVLHAQQLLVKRIVDVVGSLAGFVLLSPFFLLVAALVAIDSRGPIIFAQHRVGLGGRRFRMLKFRTMRAGAEAEKASLAHLNHTGDPRLFKIPNDPRVTRVGACLRRWSLDELPQLWNVLRGDMSLVGPRPFFESDLADYEAHHFRRLGAKPGITGLWQVSGRSNVVDFEEVVRYDREYIEQWSLGLDLWILLRTLPSMLRRTGAY